MSAAAKLALIAPDYAAPPNLADYIELAEDAVSPKMCQRIPAFRRRGLIGHVIKNQRGGVGI